MEVAVNQSRRSAFATVGVGAAIAILPGLYPRAAGEAPEALGSARVRTFPSTWKGREALAIEMTEEEQARVLKTGGNGPTYALVERNFSDGVIEVDVAAELTGKGQAESRGFVGVAFHIRPEAELYEAVYLRMSNGELNEPPPPSPRIERAVQYVAHPDFHYYVSRERFPGRYERRANIALGRWHRMRLEIQGPYMRVSVDGAEVLAVSDLRYGARKGPIGLFIDDGTRGYFRALRILDSPA
jgi:hypothetical protein